MTLNARKRLMFCALTLSAIVSVLLLPAQSFAFPDRTPQILPVNSRVEGRDYAEWTAAWWQWALAHAPDNNPVLDQTGVNAAQGQSGAVWFLAGTFGGSVVRDVTIPRGKHIFFSIANAEWDTVPGIPNPLNLPDPLSVRDLRKITAYLIENTEVTCEIDGNRVRHLRSYRAKSPVFSLNFDPELAVLFGYPAPYVRTAVSDGYWLMLKPLRVGQHVIHFTANNPVIGFALDVRYNITVTP